MRKRVRYGIYVTQNGWDVEWLRHGTDDIYGRIWQGIVQMWNSDTEMIRHGINETWKRWYIGRKLILYADII